MQYLRSRGIARAAARTAAEIPIIIFLRLSESPEGGAAAGGAAAGGAAGAAGLGGAGLEVGGAAAGAGMLGVCGGVQYWWGWCSGG